MVMSDGVDSHQEKEMFYKIPVMADFLFMYATCEGKTKKMFLYFQESQALQ